MLVVQRRDAYNVCHEELIISLQHFFQRGGGTMWNGYARVSTTEQNFDLQCDALRWAGARKLSRTRGWRAAKCIAPALRSAVRDQLGEGDVWVRGAPRPAGAVAQATD